MACPRHRGSLPQEVSVSLFGTVCIYLGSVSSPLCVWNLEIVYSQTQHSCVWLYTVSNFCLFACVNAMKSRSVSSWLGRVLKSTTLASIHMTARRRVGGHSAHCGRKRHSLGIRAGIVLRMRASFCVVHCQICGPSPHSMRRCCSVSYMPQLLHLPVGDIRIL